MVDALASEYGWSIDYILSQPIDINSQLFHAIMCRKGITVYRKQTIVSDEAATLGDRLRGIFAGVIDNPT